MWQRRRNASSRFEYWSHCSRFVPRIFFPDLIACSEQAITEDPAHVNALLAFGILMTVRDKFGEADKYFKEAVSVSSRKL